MPRQTTVAEIRLDNITTCLKLAVPLLNELNDVFGPPFVQTITQTIQAIINLIELMDSIHQVQSAIINLHIKSDMKPWELCLRQCYGTLGNSSTQQEGNKIKQLFRAREINKLLRDCRAGLREAMEVFKIYTVTENLNDIKHFENRANTMHQELLELIQTLSDTSTLSERSSVYTAANQSKNSSNSFSLLPSKPKIFHGREEGLDTIIKLLEQHSPKIAILGGGGMGKTSLARVVLHHPDTSSKFESRFFVSAEAASTSIELAALIGLHVGFNPGQDLTKPVIEYFAEKPHCLLILDNLETVWEPTQFRGGVEDFLSLPTDVEHLALVIMPPAQSHIQLICDHFPSLLELFMKYGGEQLKPVVNEITFNLENLQEILHWGLHPQPQPLQIQSNLEIIFLIEIIVTAHYCPVVSEEMIVQATIHLDHINDPLLCSKVYYALGVHRLYHKNDVEQGTQYLHKALEMSQLSGDINW
ncbi:hypothetical protein K438DRAFT_1768391 [Mycena galopus ATCC 62051]|nr:hypothetical protein K438DRAFT_1768391 [Mycena galopus ATCC 62051]